MKRFVAVIAVAALPLAACSSSGNTAEHDGSVQESESQMTTTTVAPTTTTTTAPIGPATVGETIHGEMESNSMTVHAFQPVTVRDSFLEPEPGSRWMAADVEQCVGAEWLADYKETAFGMTYSANPYQWELQMPDNTRRQAEFAIQEPALHDTEYPEQGGCLRGWITFEVPSGQMPAFVVFAETESGKYRWQV